ncbi:50S ribosomal protein L9, partial [Flavobacteriaceae bacterium]|nr:50S ribosomal protein L9 [Flavobacteriaceae bacterium]
KIVDDANKLSKKLLALDVKIKSKVGQGVKLFGSINNIDIQKNLEASGFEIDKKQIIVPGGSIKQLGKFNANIRLHREVSVEFPFEIIPDSK